MPSYWRKKSDGAVSAGSHGLREATLSDEGTDRGGQADLLGEMKVLRRRARTARHAYWFPLVLFGVLTCASVPFYIQPDVPAGLTARASGGAPGLPVLGGYSGFLVHRYLGYYWLAALLAGLLLTLLWYRRNAHRVGLQTPARGYVITVATLTALTLVIPPLSRVRSPRWHLVSDARDGKKQWELFDVKADPGEKTDDLAYRW